MHSHLEIIMPPTHDIEAAVTEIMAPFDENGDRPNAFWDFWKIGGRYGGSKIEATLGQDRLTAFRQLLADRHVTVRGLTFGKPTMFPADQKDAVDALWVEHFPDAPTHECPLFDCYKGSLWDVVRFGETPMSMTCCHVIFAALNYTGEKLVAVHMITKDCWNGVNHQDTTWDQTLSGALEFFEKRLGHVDKYRPTPDWLCVTVDYHS